MSSARSLDGRKWTRQQKVDQAQDYSALGAGA